MKGLFDNVIITSNNGLQQYTTIPAIMTTIRTSINTSWSEMNRSVIDNNGGVFAKGGGTCVPDSIRTWCKLHKAGAVRMRGKRFGKYHYWVANKGKVFDISGNYLTIVKTDEYYRNFGITVPEPATYSGLFIEEVMWINGGELKEYLTDLKTPTDFKRIKSLLSQNFYQQLIQIIHKTFVPPVYDADNNRVCANGVSSVTPRK